MNIINKTRNMNRRDFIKQASLVSLGLAVTNGLSARTKDFDEVVRIGYLPITDATALLIAHEVGFFKEEGLKSVKPTLIRGWSPLVESFIAKKFNVVHLLNPIPIWMRFAHQVPVKIVAWAHTNGSALLVGKHTNVNSVSQLGGKSIAVPYWYSIHNILLQQLLRNAGLVPVIKAQGKELKPNEVNLQILPPPEMPVALLSKKIDGYIVAEPFNALGELRAKAKIIRFTGDVWKNHPCCVVTMHENVLNEHAEWSQKVINAIVKAQAFATNNRSETAKILSKEKSALLPFEEKIVSRAMNHYDDKDYLSVGANRNKDKWQNSRIDFDPYPYPSATEYLISSMQTTLVEGDKKFLDGINIKATAKDIVDDRFIRNILSNNPKLVSSLNKQKELFVRKETFDL